MIAPSLSIVMPLYNNSDSVLRAVSSVQAQAISDWELIVVDDGSTDGGASKVVSLNDFRIKTVRQANQGVSSARNLGISLACSELIAFLDADDEWAPEFLSSVLALVCDYPDANWFATGYQIRHPREGVFKARLRGTDPAFARGLVPNYFQVAIRSDPPVWSSAVVVRRHAIQSISGFPENIGSGEDLLTWARLAVRYALAYDTRQLAVFHVSGNDRQADPEKRVSEGLAQLLREYPHVVGLRAYLGLWCRMQSVMAARVGATSLARHCAWRAVYYGPRQWRNTYVLLMAWLPRNVRHFLDGAARQIYAALSR